MLQVRFMLSVLETAARLPLMYNSNLVTLILSLEETVILTLFTLVMTAPSKGLVMVVTGAMESEAVEGDGVGVGEGVAVGAGRADATILEAFARPDP